MGKNLPQDTFASIINEFNKEFYPFTVGFDSMFKQINDMSKTMQKVIPQTNFPPYNIKKVKENKYVIEMAVAGFSKSDIEVTLDGNNLIISGNSKNDDSVSNENFIYKGIADRSFKRMFTLEDKIEIKDAELVNGMLKIWLESFIKTQETIKKIDIKEKS